MGGASRPAPEVAPVDDGQIGLFGDQPQVAAAPAGPFQSIYIHFETAEDVAAFAAFVGQPVSTQTSAIFYPAGDLQRRFLPDAPPEARAPESAVDPSMVLEAEPDADSVGVPILFDGRRGVRFCEIRSREPWSVVLLDGDEEPRCLRSSAVREVFDLPRGLV